MTHLRNVFFLRQLLPGSAQACGASQSSEDYLIWQQMRVYNEPSLYLHKLRMYPAPLISAERIFLLLHFIIFTLKYQHYRLFVFSVKEQ